MNLKNKIIRQARSAADVAKNMAGLSSRSKNQALVVMARALKSNQGYLLRENKKDLTAAVQKGYAKSLVDRLTLHPKRIDEMACCLLDTAKLNDPVGEIMRTIKRPNGLIIKKVRTPIGVVGIIYESRPNVTSDCIGLCLKSGNAVILKGGKEAIYSNKAIFKVLRDSLKKTKVPMSAINLVTSTDRQAVQVLLTLDQYVDVIVPRGGEGLIRFVAENSCIPVIKHYKGVCHTYVSDKADLNMARRICFNAKVQRPGVCNAMETLLIHQSVARKFLPLMAADFIAANVELRGCPQTKRILGNKTRKATRDDWKMEYLDLILAIKVVKNLKEAVDHINTYGSKHSDAIVTNNVKEAEAFFKTVDSACLYANASTRFTDGYQFGFGAEIGISTDKLHARGPMALEELTTYKYVIIGKGQIRK